MKKDEVIDMFVKHMTQQKMAGSTGKKTTGEPPQVRSIEVQNCLFQLVNEGHLIQNEYNQLIGISWKGLELLNALITK